MIKTIDLNEQSLFVIFAVILVGILCQRRKILNHEHIEGLEIFLFKIAMPCYLFNATLHHDLAKLLHGQYIASYLLAFIAMAVITTLCFYKQSNNSSLYVKILATGYVNAAIYALPIIVFLLKDPTAAILGNLLQVIIIQSTFIVLLSFINHKEKSILKKLMTIFNTPIIIMPLLGLLLNFIQLQPYPIVTHAIKNIGSGTTSLALFTFGLNLGGIKLSKSYLNKDLWLIVGLKNILHPLIAFTIGKHIFGLEQYWLYSLIIATAAPTAFIVYFIARQFNIEQDLIKKVVAISSIISLISLIIIIWII